MDRISINLGVFVKSYNFTKFRCQQEMNMNWQTFLRLASFFSSSLFLSHWIIFVSWNCWHSGSWWRLWNLRLFSPVMVEPGSLTNSDADLVASLLFVHDSHLVWAGITALWQVNCKLLVPILPLLNLAEKSSSLPEILFNFRCLLKSFSAS